jgi:hypothetical protein
MVMKNSPNPENQGNIVHLNLAVQLLLPDIKLQFVMVMDTCEGCGAMIDIVGAVAKIKVNDIDRDNLHRGCIRLALFLMLGDDLRCAIEHPLQVIKFERASSIQSMNSASSPSFFRAYHCRASVNSNSASG